MFARLFAESGLSLDRLKALLEVNAAGSIVKAASGDPIRQSQFSRQIKELEDFFRVKLIERHGKGTRLTPDGKELARISRFFLLGLSNFRRGCLAEEQNFHIGGSATVIAQFILPALSGGSSRQAGPRFAVEGAGDDEIERRLHDLTLDFGVVTSPVLSRPLQLKAVGRWQLVLWTPRGLCRDRRRALADFKSGQLPLVIPAGEMPRLAPLADYKPRLICNSFLEARSVLATRPVAVFLPSFLRPTAEATEFISTPVPGVTTMQFHFHLAWNPRLLRLNPRAIRVRDSLMAALSQRMQSEVAV